jgi:lipopolysaccharide export system permease protein
MRLSTTLSIYLVRSLLLNLLYIFLAFCFIGFILDLLELFRKVQGKEIFIGQILRIAFYKVPFLAFSFLPFIFLFGSILTFTKFNNNFEISAANAAGISTWSLTIPLGLTILVLSFLILMVFQPVSAIFLDKNRLLENKYFGYTSNRVSLNSKGIWLHDQSNNPMDEKFITAKHVLENGKSLADVEIYYAGPSLDYTTIYKAKTVSIDNGRLHMKEVSKYLPGNNPEYYPELDLSSSLLARQIQESIPNPEIIPLWNLSSLIEQMKESGFSTLKHELYYKSSLASPVLYVSLVFMALACSLSLPRKSKLGIVFVWGSMIAIVFYFIDKMINVMALTATLPLNVAAITPSVAYLLISAAVLIHCEER